MYGVVCRVQGAGCHPLDDAEFAINIAIMQRPEREVVRAGRDECPRQRIAPTRDQIRFSGNLNGT